jgi:hypothetical protein
MEFQDVVFGAATSAQRGLFDLKSTYYPRDVVFLNGDYWFATRKIAPPWYSITSTLRASDVPGRSGAWRKVPTPGAQAEKSAVLGADDLLFGTGYAHGLDVLGAGPIFAKKAPVSAGSAAKKAQIAAAQAKVKKSASAAEKKIATAVSKHASHPPKTHAGAVKAANAAAARAALVGKRLAKRVPATKVIGEVLDDMIGAVKPSPKRAQALDKLRAAAKSVGVSSKHAAEAAKAHAAARSKINASAVARQKALQQKQTFKKKK